MLTSKRLQEVLVYDKETGIFLNLVTRGRMKAGREPGTIDCGYRNIMVDGVVYKAHRLAWLYVYGTFPDHDLDHINGDGLDNRISNLRECDPTLNSRNVVLPHSNNTSGFLGVSLNKRGKWEASIRFGGKQKYLGSFSIPEEASAAYWKAKEKYHGLETYEKRLDTL